MTIFFKIFHRLLVINYRIGSNPDPTYPSIYRICVYFWILFGLAFMAAVISLFSDLIKGSGKNSYKIVSTIRKLDFSILV